MKKILFILIMGFLTFPSIASVTYGEASWYGIRHHGRTTANGEKFNKNALTCAHRTFPFNTLLKVTNLSNNKSVIVRVTDRGPTIKNRVIDLSEAAAKAIGIEGVGKVKITVIKEKKTVECTNLAPIKPAEFVLPKIEYKKIEFKPETNF